MNKQEIEDFRSKVKDWIECDNEINELNNKIKEIKSKKIELNNEILQFMQDNNIEDISTKQCKLKTYTSTSQKGLNKDYIKSKLKSVFDDEHKAIEITDIILNNREKTTTTKLKRINIKDTAGGILNLS
tara:strand:- start:126 stop:512 length:387 start_codon:yes stop_codon:yes gene_type:complete